MDDLRRIDLNLLLALHALLTEKHVTRAAMRLHKSQPAVSHSLAQLREHFNDPLLVRKQGKLEADFGDSGCNTLLHFLNAMDTALAMGASEAKRLGYVLSRPEAASKCLAVLGDGTECHSGMDATRNTVFRQVPGVKVVLDNYWTAMTGGQPAPTSPVNLAGKPNTFDLVKSLEATGARTAVLDA